MACVKTSFLQDLSEIQHYFKLGLPPPVSKYFIPPDRYNFFM